MVKLPFRVALVVAVALWASAEARPEAPTYSRRNAITEAVAKTRMGVITLDVTKDGTYGGKRSIAGSGFVVDERGYALTNYHVIADASRIIVTLGDKTRVEASIHKELPKLDLAILKFETTKKIKGLTLAPAADLMQGETVIAIGNPHGFSGTVSTGIISALDRDIAVGAASLKGLIQHSASINPGNSGGPLLNINGELIGVNVALREGSQGISFAINADTVKGVLSKHLSAIKISKVSHGLDCAEKVVGEEGDRQQVVVKAAAGDMKAGDVILAVGKRTLSNRFDLERSLWGHKAGDVVEATVLRGGKKTTVSITLSSPATRTASTR
jgi:serine protease Do